MKQNPKKAFTLIEMIIVVVISGVLASGTFKAMEALYIRSAKAKAITDLSMQSQIVLNQISRLLYNRIPNTVIGYDGSSATSCTPIEDINNDTSKVLEWLSLDDEQLLSSKYGGFIDMNASSKPNLKALDVDSNLVYANRNLIFAGSFDSGSEDISTCNGAYGWHGNDSNLSHGIDSVDTNKIVLKDTSTDKAPEYIYEKYYLTDGAYAVTRGAELSQSDLESNCDNGNYKFPKDINFTTTLFLFYDYHPYDGETYCGDKSGTNKEGNVAILAKDVASFGAVYENDIIRLSIDINRSIRGSNPVHISKQKAVF